MNFQSLEHSDQIVKPARKRNIKLFVTIFIVVLLVVAGLSAYFLTSKNSSRRLPASITSSISYPIYYPTNAKSFSYKSGSANIKAGILFYTLTNGSKKIFVTEQYIPNNRVNLSSLPEHTALKVPIGQAVVGTGLGNPSIIIMTSSGTLIELTSNKAVTKSNITDIAQSMAVVTNS